jgi:Leucine-rich repeat (LRR) protein
MNILETIQNAIHIGATELNLSGQGLDSLPIKISQLKNLTKLNLSHNPLSSLPSEISQLKNLTELDLSGTQLSHLPVEICQLSNLKRLYLSYNPQLSSLSKAISQLISLTYLLSPRLPTKQPVREDRSAHKRDQSTQKLDQAKSQP